ncbi:MAG: metal-dependent hydrolase [Pirellulales bacterium]|nr:metal-dependent hydrolase [Pirellulales bacterium]
MTSFEHALVGINGSLALGLHRRWGWAVVALAAVESVLPDWDGLTLGLGPQAYAAGHRVWGHNLLLAGLVAAVTAVVLYRFDAFGRIARATARRWPKLGIAATSSSETRPTLGGATVWMLVAVVAAWVHLLADALFSSGHGLTDWELPLLWPFSDALFAWPTVRWGDVVPTLILAAGMFALVRWPRRVQRTATITLLLLASYITVRGMMG